MSINISHANLRFASNNPQELAKLSPAQRDYVLDNLGDLLDAGNEINVSRPDGNGNEPVITLQTAELKQQLSADPTLTYKVQTHYHGDIRPAPEYSDRNTILDAMKRIWDKDRTTVFVLPQTNVFGAATGSEPVPTQLGYKAWNNVSDESGTTRDALLEAGLDPDRVSDRTVSAHSSGGYPLSRVMAATANDPENVKIDANRILIMDTVRGALSDDRIPQWWHERHPDTITYIDATNGMREWTKDEAESFGWNYQLAKDHFDAVRSFFDYRGQNFGTLD